MSIPTRKPALLIAVMALGLSALPLSAQAPARTPISEAQTARLMAARMHAESAGERQADDPQAAACLRTAAFYVGDVLPARAAEWLVAAADHAIARGDVETAAHSLVDAASALDRGASDASQRAQGVELIARARLLARSPLLSAGARAVILERIEAVAAGEIAGVVVR